MLIIKVLSFLLKIVRLAFILHEIRHCCHRQGANAFLARSGSISNPCAVQFPVRFVEDSARHLNSGLVVSSELGSNIAANEGSLPANR